MEPIVRWQEEKVRRMLGERRVVVIGGARQVGKTTLAKRVAGGATYRTLDDPVALQMAREDPQTFLTHGPGTLVIDEVQKAPGLISAIKMRVDEDPRPGQFLLTGSANIQTLPAASESLAGRVHHARLCPLTRGELLGRPPRFFDRLRALDFPATMEPLSRNELQKMIFRGGFPAAVASGGEGLREWFEDYVAAVVLRDAADLAKARRTDVLGALVRTLAGWSSKFLNVTEMARDLGVSFPTLREYLSTLKLLYLVDEVPSWSRTDCGRVGRRSKFFLADTGLMAALLGLTTDSPPVDGDRWGKLVETFAYGELLAQRHLTGGIATVGHYRDHQSREIDFLVETSAGELWGIEVKGSTQVHGNDFRHLEWFAGTVARDRPFTGIVLYNGQWTRRHGEKLFAVPIQTLWE